MPLGIGYAAMESRISNQNWSLLERASIDNSFSVDVTCERLWIVHTKRGLQYLLDQTDLADEDTLVVGDRTNILFTKDCKSLIIPAIRGIQYLSSTNDTELFRVGAGENWDEFVQWSLGHALFGLENLAGIPGTVGASPVQNIGAYGVEVGAFIQRVHCIDRCSRKHLHLSNRECEFGYRTSIFKAYPHRYLITSVDFKLRKSTYTDTSYNALAKELHLQGIEEPQPQDVARAVRALRSRRLPSPLINGNAGSFFKNPIVTIEIANRLKEAYPSLPIFPFDKYHRKLGAAWMIETCGFRGIRQGFVGVSEKHALVIVNFGSATGQDIWTFAQQIQREVFERFGIRLQPEPQIV